jgi:hypothetical protein
MGIFELLQLLPIFLGAFAGLAALVPFLVYLIAAWRNRQEGRVEPRLALVSVYGFFANLGFTMATLSLTALLAMLFEGATSGDALKTPSALFISGAIIFAVTFFPLRGATRHGGSRAGRIYLGLTAFTAALLTTVAFTGFIIALINGARVSMPIAVLITQDPVAVFGALLLARTSSYSTSSAE